MIERRPDRSRVVPEHQVAGIIKSSRGHPLAGRVGLPHGGARPVDEPEVAVGEELERPGGVDGGDGGPDGGGGAPAAVGDGGDEGGRVGGGGDEAEGEGLVGGRPGMVEVGGGEGRAGGDLGRDRRRTEEEEREEQEEEEGKLSRGGGGGGGGGHRSPRSGHRTGRRRSMRKWCSRWWAAGRLCSSAASAEGKTVNEVRRADRGRTWSNFVQIGRAHV